MTLAIVVNQAGAPAGVPGFAREDLALGVTGVLTITGGPYLSQQWTIVDKPDNLAIPSKSSAAFSAPTLATTNLSPIDNAGTYFIRVAVDAGFGLGARPQDVAEITFYAGPALASGYNQFPRRTPAFQETTQHNVKDSLDPVTGNPKGWSRELQRWLAAAAAVGISASVQVYQNNVPVAGGPFTIFDFITPINTLNVGAGVIAISVDEATHTTTGTIKVAGDLDGNGAGQQVVAVTGAGGTVAVHGAHFLWDNSLATPSIKQAQAATTSGGQPFAFNAQDAGPTAAVNTLGGALILGAGDDNGVTFGGATNHAPVQFKSHGTFVGAFYMDSRANNVLDLSQTGTPYILGTNSVEIRATTPGSGIVRLTAPFAVTFQDGTNTNLVIFQSTPAGTTNVQFAEQTTALVSQADRTSDAAMHDFTIQAAAPFIGATVNKNAPNLVLATGANLAAGGVDGKISLKIGVTGEIVAVQAAGLRAISGVTTAPTYSFAANTKAGMMYDATGGVNIFGGDVGGVGKSVVLSAGAAGVGTNGAVSLSTTDGTTSLAINLTGAGGTTLQIQANLIQLIDSAAAAAIVIQRAGTVAATGQSTDYKGGNAATTGGDITMSPGTGATGGSVRLRSSTGTTRIQVDGTGIGVFGATPVARSAAYTISNDTPTRTLNVSTAVLADVANVLATVMKDFGASGVGGYGWLH